jgi:hypothetical protein
MKSQLEKKLYQLSFRGVSGFNGRSGNLQWLQWLGGDLDKEKVGVPDLRKTSPKQK